MRQQKILLAATIAAAVLITGPAVQAGVEGGIEAFVDRDYAKVIKEFRKVLKKKRKPEKAQLIMARMYLDGLGVPVNYSRAYQYLLPAADKGNAWAQTEVAHLIATGRGPMQSYKRAKEYYTKAAMAGYGPAQLALGRSILKGQGSSQDYVLAYAWLNLAAADLQRLDRIEATKLRQDLTKMMSRNEIAKAQTQSLKWSDEIVVSEPEIVALMRNSQIAYEDMSVEAMSKKVGDLVKAMGVAGEVENAGREIAKIGQQIGQQLDKKLGQKLASQLKTPVDTSKKEPGAPGATAGKSKPPEDQGFFASMMSAVSDFFGSLFGSDEAEAAKPPTAKSTTPVASKTAN